jgi:hypothetical protein
MVTTSTADSRRIIGLHTLVLLAFLLVQATALAHEIRHVSNLHEGPCGLHDAAEHLAMAPPPEPAPVVALAPATRAPSAALGPRRLPPTRLSGARAPPLLS